MRWTLAAVTAASAALAGCHAHDMDGGATVSRSYQIGNFHSIEVAGPYAVDVRTGGNPGVTAKGPEHLLEQTVVEVDGDKLLIHPKHHGWFHFGWRRNGKVGFIVTVPQLAGATIAGSGDIRVDRVAGQSFEGTVAGSGGLDVMSTDVQQLKLNIAGPGGARAGAGKAQSAEYSITGSGDLDAGAVQTQQAKVSIAGSGSVKAHASVAAEVSVMGSGDVDVSGGAKCSISKAGSGNVHCS